MATAFLDTNAVSDLMRGQIQIKSRVGAHPDPIVTSAVVVGEIRYGLDRLPFGKKRADLEARARNILAALRIEPVTELVANAYGGLKASLENQGLMLDDNDLWIAASAIAGGGLWSRATGLSQRFRGSRLTTGAYDDAAVSVRYPQTVGAHPDPGENKHARASGEEG